jgi:C4-dicarboxylate-specific signal transduction histidine kinase
VEEGKRAGEVIHRVRELLRKSAPERARLDLNDVVRDVVKLLGNDVMIRGVTLAQQLAPEPLTTEGDRVQLRQVVLNVVVNALDALGGSSGGRVVIRTERMEGGFLRASISDNGPGVRAIDTGDVFKPFYTTKENGLGMGLSIARSILESHGGAISVRANGDGGATFEFTLPSAVIGLAVS